ncbi:MAG: hypothetical protein IAF94_18870 [Pirellulaceae bacterium]|nr:hypothetical protein [Pirellulaceae bacterium]
MSHEELTIYYPSGKLARFFGRFIKHGKIKPEQDARYAVAIESLESVVVNDKVVAPGSVLIFDPRGVVWGQKSGEIYTPRPYMQDFPVEMRDWMESNPDWPARLKLDDELSSPGRVSLHNQRQKPK